MSLSKNFPTIRPSLLLDFASAGRLDPRITFARASPAVYYDGVTQTRAEQNLILWSQEFQQSAWDAVTLGTTVTANTTVAPDGTTTADTLAFVPTAYRYNSYAAGTLTGRTFTFSCWVWTTTTPKLIGVRISNSSGTEATALQVGTTSTATRVSVTRTFGGSDTVIICGFDNRSGFGGNGIAGSIVVWGAQLEERSTATAYNLTTTQPITTYIPTLVTAPANTARFDYNPTTSVALGLLVEQARINLVLYSEAWNDATWSKFNTTITANTAVAPGGTVTADAIVENTAAGAYHSTSQNFSKAAVATTYTFSVYAKSANRTIGLRLAETSPGTSGAVTAYNLATGALVTAAGTYGPTFTNASGSITAVGNGWYRVTLTVTTGPETTIQTQVYMENGVSSVYTGDGWSNILLWGAQLEAGACVTSYIATVATTQTRQADQVTMTGVNFSNWFNASEFTIVTQSTLVLDAGNFPRLVSINNGVDNLNVLRQSANGDTLFESNFVTYNGVSQFNFFNAITRNTTYKKALAVKNNNNAYARNDFTSVQTSATGSPPLACNQISIMGDSVNGFGTNGYINRLYVYPLRLTDTQIFNLTR